MFELGDHSPPSLFDFSKIRGVSPASSIVFAAARPDGPAPRRVLVRRNKGLADDSNSLRCHVVG